MADSIKVTIQKMQDDIKHTAEAVDRLETNTAQAIDRLEGKIDKFIESSEKHFAAKWTESAIKWFLFTVASLLIAYAFMKLLGANFNSSLPTP